MFIYTLLASLLFFSTPSISDDPYYSDVNYCDIYQYCDNPELDESYLVDGDMTDEPDMLMNENWLMDWMISEGLWDQCLTYCINSFILGVRTTTEGEKWNY